MEIQLWISAPHATSLRSGSKAGDLTGKATAPASPLWMHPAPSDFRAGLVSNFDDASTRTAFGPSWEAFEGVHMNLVVGGAQGSHGSLVMSGDVKADRPAYLWPGMVFIPSGLLRVPSNLSSKLGLQFWAKGDGRTYRVVIVGEAGPQEKVFKPGPNCRSIGSLLTTSRKLIRNGCKLSTRGFA